VTDTHAAGARPQAWWRAVVLDVVVVLPAWIAARLLVAAAYVGARVISDRLGEHGPALGEGLLAWDGTWYRAIARSGYEAIDLEGVRFFPAFPLLGRLLGSPFGIEGAALVVVANLAALVLGVLVLRLMRAEGASQGSGIRAVWLVMIFPSAFVLVWGYAESLMLVGAVGTFLALRRQQWWWAAAGGLLAATCRPVGLVLVLPAAIEVARTWKGASTSDRFARVAAVLGPVLGTGAYLWWVAATFGDAFLPFNVQEELRGEPVNPLGRVWDGLADLVGPERFGDGLHLPFAVAFLALLVLTFRRWPASYGAFAAGVLVLALSADNLNSLERYGLNAFPLVLTMALYTADDRVERPVLTVSAAGFVLLATLSWTGAYVP
jgi:hypothetical protein